jgi:hypothetical protein
VEIPIISFNKKFSLIPQNHAGSGESCAGAGVGMRFVTEFLGFFRNKGGDGVKMNIVGYSFIEEL